MRAGIDFGRQHLDVDVPDGCLVGTHSELPDPPLIDPLAAIREAVEVPHGFPALRRTLTPDDHVAIVIDEGLPSFSALVTGLLEHIAEAQVSAERITLICPAAGQRQDWVDNLPEVFEDVRVEVHDPTDRKKLSYLATTKSGVRLYLNRTAVDADQLVVLSRRCYDAQLGYSGAEGAIFPALANEATQKQEIARLSLDVPDEEPWPLSAEAQEVAWLMGAPFMVNVIDGWGDDLTHIVAGTAEAGKESIRLLNARWRTRVDQRVDLVVAGISGDPARHSFASMAAAVNCAARVLKPRGRIVLLTEAAPQLLEGAELLRHCDDPGKALEQLQEGHPLDMAAAFQWASAAQEFNIYLLSRMPSETVEELFATPLDRAGQVQKLILPGQLCLFLADAHKALAVLK